MVVSASSERASHAATTFYPPAISPEFLRVESSIQALSTAIHLIQRQCQSYQTNSYDVVLAEKDRARVFTHLSTLLTTGSPSGRQTVAVTGGSSHNGFFINATENVVAQEHAYHGSSRPKVVEILPSNKTLKQLAEPRRSSSRIPFPEHAGDVLQALRLASQDRQGTDHRLLECFVIRRCHREIIRRLKSALDLSNPPLHDVLAKWDLQNGDHINEEWFPIAYPKIFIESSRIPYRPIAHCPDKFELLFNRHTLDLWKNFFVSLIRVVIDALSGPRPERRANVTDIVLALHFLRLFLVFGPAREILQVRSLESRLESLLQPPACGPQDGTTTESILRAWTAIVAHTTAVASLTARNGTVMSILRQSLPKVHIFQTSMPATPKPTMESIPRLMRCRILPALNLGPKRLVMAESLISRHLFAAEFDGHVHCEAGMMGITCAFSHDAPQANLNDPNQLNAFYSAFEGHSNTIGTTEPACQICYWLSEELQTPQGSFNLQASHEREVVPWTPPRFGIPLSVLNRLEVELMELLKDSTERWIEHRLSNQDAVKMCLSDFTPGTSRL
ncbi:hypothetical protein R3P38DRAFT_2868063 [Favolaschia claudopus]|uniref:Uncharacterized protein n=1 Tax=Favolaschia claudopus TaxID=2862362 RepID=A0AAW0DA50_9AGAR